MTPSWIRAPPLSFRPITGAPTFIAVSMILTILFACISPRLPPKTVKSCEKTNTVRPSIVPWPVTTPSPRTRFASIPNSVVRCSTKASVSTKLPESSRSSTRSRAVIFPFACCAWIRSLPPPCLARAFLRRSSSTRSSPTMGPPNAARVINPSRVGLGSQRERHLGRASLHRSWRRVGRIFTKSLEDLEGSFEELVLRSLVVRNHERTVRRDVVRFADHAIFPDHRGDPLPDRRALPAVVLQEEFDPRVAVPRIPVVELMQEIVEEFFVRDEEAHFPLQCRGLRLDFGGELLQIHVRVHADAHDDVVHVVPVDALGQDPRNLPILIHRVVGVLQAREHAQLTQRLHDRHPDEQAQDPGMRLLRSQDERGVQPAERRGPGPAVSSTARGLTVRPDDEALLHVGLEKFLRGLVRRLDRVEMEDGPADDLAIRVANFADLQRESDERRDISTCASGGRLRRGGPGDFRQVLAPEEAFEHHGDPNELADVQRPGNVEPGEGSTSGDDKRSDSDP